MDKNLNNEESAIVQNSELLNKKIKSVPKPKVNNTGLSDLGIATKIAEVGSTSQIDMGVIDSFTQISQARDQLYQLLDTMGDDPTVAAVLETYAEDATEYNEQGDIIWAESDDPEISKYINYLLKALQVNKNAYKWIYALCKYGDLYLQLFKESEYTKDDFFNVTLNDKNFNDRQNLNEDVKLNLYKKEDHYVNYIEMVANPATMFELTKFGKTAGFIKTDVNTITKNKNFLLTNAFQYKFKKNDINIFNGDKFVHAALEDNSSRVPEEVELFMDEEKMNEGNGTKYTVKRGQSLLYNVFKIWRELSLLENSMLLNRITKSSIVRVIGVEIGDMPKEDVRGYLQGIKELMEQKSAINEGNNMSEYTNPGPIENNIYVPTKGGQGAITTTQVGGDVNVGQLPDIDYFTNKYYGALRVPKQYFGFTDDAAGFNGGSSLSIISSRYAKMIKRLQNTLIQALTDVMNLMLIDKKMGYYIGQFTIKMQPPTTQEEIDRRENVSSKMQIVGDVMNQLSDIDDKATKLKILKSLLSNIITDTDVIGLIDEEIKKLESEGSEVTEGTSSEEDEFGGGESLGSSGGSGIDLDSELGLSSEGSEIETGEEEPSEATASEAPEETLPTPEELGGEELDFTNSNEF